MELDPILLGLLFFIIATVYSSAGFGGGSSYLAILSMTSLHFTDIKLIALCCNIMVVANSIYLFHSNHHIKWKKIAPLIILSVPMAYLGGRLELSERIFFVILGFVLFISSLLMFVKTNSEIRKLPKSSNAAIGGGIGFLSGLVGIGGGIFLSPLLHLSKWDKVKTIAATTAVFIFVNSLAGLGGQISNYGFHTSLSILGPLLLAVFIGSQIGTRMSIKKWSPEWVKKITAFLILFVSLRILYQYLL